MHKVDITDKIEDGFYWVVNKWEEDGESGVEVDIVCISNVAGEETWVYSLSGSRLVVTPPRVDCFFNGLGKAVPISEIEGEIYGPILFDRALLEDSIPHTRSLEDKIEAFNKIVEEGKNVL